MSERIVYNMWVVGMQLITIKRVVGELEGIHHRLNVGSEGALPSRDMIRANMCELQHCIDSLREYVYLEAR